MNHDVWALNTDNKCRDGQAEGKRRRLKKEISGEVAAQSQAYPEKSATTARRQLNCSYPKDQKEGQREDKRQGDMQLRFNHVHRREREERRCERAANYPDV